MHTFHRWASVALAATLLSGCATRQLRTSQPPVKGPATAAAPESLSDYMTKIRHLSANARPLTKSEAAETLETKDPAIAAELLLVSSQPTAERYLSLAERYRERGVLDAAYRHFNRVIALDPRNGAAYEGLARVWRDWDLPGLALGDAHRAVYYRPLSASAWNTYGTVMQALGHYDNARAAYQRASSLDTAGAYAVNNLCYLAFLEGRIDTAIDACTMALELDPSMATARNNLALAFAAAGRADLAHAHFANTSDPASGLYNMGLVYLASGDHAGALNAFDEASKARPTFNLARERSRQLRAQMFLANRKQTLQGGSSTIDRANPLLTDKQ